MSAEKLHARFDALAREFLLPLLQGGPARAGTALTPGMLEHFAFARPADSDIDRGIYARLHDDASEIAPLRALEWPERGLAATYMAAHNLVAVTDPKLDRMFSRGARPKMLDWVDWFLDAAGAPQTRGAALARHAVVSRVLRLTREDVIIKNWAYTYRYFGRPVPGRVVAMPRVRMVHEETATLPVTDIWEELEKELPVMSRARALVARSPVTDILDATLGFPLDFGTAALAVLSDDLVRNGIARKLVEGGAGSMGRLGGALGRFAAQRPPPRLLFYVLALIYEAHVIAVLDARAGKDPIFARPNTPDERLFCAVLPAMVGAPDDLGALLDLDPDDLVQVRKQAAVLDGRARSEAVKRAIELVDYAEPPRLDHERDRTEPFEVRP